MKREIIAVLIGSAGVFTTIYGIQGGSTLIQLSGAFILFTAELYIHHSEKAADREFEREFREAMNRERAWQTFLNVKMPPER